MEVLWGWEATVLRSGEPTELRVKALVGSGPMKRPWDSGIVSS